MHLEAVIGQTWGGVKAIFRAHYDNNIPEDTRFQKATPNAMFELVIDNPKAIEELEIGAYYYFDMIKVPKIVHQQETNKVA